MVKENDFSLYESMIDGCTEALVGLEIEYGGNVVLTNNGRALQHRSPPGHCTATLSRRACAHSHVNARHHGILSPHCESYRIAVYRRQPTLLWRRWRTIARVALPEANPVFRVSLGFSSSAVAPLIG